MAKSCVDNEQCFRDGGWAELLLDLLDDIVRHIDSYGNYVRLRSVCKHWNLKLPKNPKYIKNLWLVLPFEDEKEILRPFLNLGENKMYHIELPQTRNTVLRGSYYEWLISIGIDGALQMLNPFTGAQFDLPPLHTFPDIVNYQPEHEHEEYTIGKPSGTYTLDKIHMQKAYIQKIIISSPPNCVEYFMALAIYGDYDKLCYFRSGDNNWTDFPTEYKICMEDATFYDGKIYAVDDKAQLYEYKFDIKTGGSLVGGIVPVIPPKYIGDSWENTMYVVGTPFGLLLVIRCLHFYSKHTVHKGIERTYCYKTSGFDIFKLSNDKEQITWSKLNSLEDYVLLIGNNSSMCMRPQTFPDGKGNRIYFTDNKHEPQYVQVIGGHDIGVFDLEDESINYVFPNLERLLPPPVWLLKR